MDGRLAPTSPRRAALIAGVGYLAIFVLAIFANFFVIDGLLVPGDAATTFANVAESPLLFRAGIFSFLIVFVLDVAVAWALYVLFRSVSEDLSLLTAWFRLVYTVFLGVAAIFLFAALQLTGGSEYLSSFDPGQLGTQVLLHIDAFNYAWLVGLACFGVHLLMVAYLLSASGSAPRLLGWVLAVAGAAYVIDTSAHTLLANYDDYATVFLAIVAIPSVVGELWFAFWLLLRAGTDETAVAAGE